MSDWANDLLDEEVAVKEPEHEVIEKAQSLPLRLGIWSPMTSRWLATWLGR